MAKISHKSHPHTLPNHITLTLHPSLLRFTPPDRVLRDLLRLSQLLLETKVPVLSVYDQEGLLAHLFQATIARSNAVSIDLNGPLTIPSTTTPSTTTTTSNSSNSSSEELIYVISQTETDSANSIRVTKYSQNRDNKQGLILLFLNKTHSHQKILSLTTNSTTASTTTSSSCPNDPTTTSTTTNTTNTTAEGSSPTTWTITTIDSTTANSSPITGRNSASYCRNSAIDGDWRTERTRMGSVKLQYRVPPSSTITHPEIEDLICSFGGLRVPLPDLLIAVRCPLLPLIRSCLSPLRQILLEKYRLLTNCLLPVTTTNSSSNSSNSTNSSSSSTNSSSPTTSTTTNSSPITSRNSASYCLNSASYCSKLLKASLLLLFGHIFRAGMSIVNSFGPSGVQPWFLAEAEVYQQFGLDANRVRGTIARFQRTIRRFGQ